MSSHPPSIHKKAFSCPHCGAYANQQWFQLYAAENVINGKPSLPIISTNRSIEKVNKNTSLTPADKISQLWMINKLISGFVFFEEEVAYHGGSYLKTENIHLSKCAHCENIAVWLNDRLIFPNNKYEIQPNPDMSDDVKSDYEEAREIVDASPRGAAALLRLAIQKICIELEGKGKDLDENIRGLVRKGLHINVQKALDAVRVIGNESVHPGEINLRDDRDTAYRMFDLVNLICEEMISRQKKVNEVYNKLPEKKREAIKKRDKKKD